MFSPHERLSLLAPTDPAWIAAACADTAGLLADHAHCEKKAAATAISLISRHPDDHRLVESMLHLAQEELRHFERIYAVMRARRIPLARDAADPYVRALLGLARSMPAENLVDRLLALGLVEARSCERFLLLADNLQDAELRDLYADLALPEEGHSHLFVSLAERHLPGEQVQARLTDLRQAEAAIVRSLPSMARMHG